MLEESMASEKLAVMAEFTSTSVAPLIGVVELTPGGVVSGAAKVVALASLE